jgi:hypothetical protein
VFFNFAAKHFTMKKIFLLLSLHLMYAAITPVAGQLLITQVKPSGSKYWGYANIKGELIIPAQFEKCYRFSPSGYATIYDTKERQYHFINTKGERLKTEISDFKIHDGFGFDVDGFVDERVAIKVGKTWGFLDASGKLAIPARYDDVTEFSGGYASAKSGGNFVLLNTKGDEIKPAITGITDIKTFSEGLAPFRGPDKKFGFLNSSGQVAIPAKFESVGYFRNGLAWAKTDGKLLGYIDTKGNWVIEPKFVAGKDFDEKAGLARIKTADGKWAYTNRKGEIIYVTDTDVWGDFKEGLADGRKNGKRGFYNNKGEWVIQPQFEGVRDFKNGYAAAKLGDKWGVIDKTGKWVIQPQYDGIKDMEKVDQ